MAKRFQRQAVVREQERRRKRRLENKWPIMVAALRIDDELKARIEEAARRNHRRPYQDALAALRWYYLEMWREQ